MNSHAAHVLEVRQFCSRVIVLLAAGDDVNVPALAGQMKREIAQDLACRRMIGKEKPIEKDDALHHTRLRRSASSIPASS